MQTHDSARIQQDLRVAQKRLGELAKSEDILRWLNHQCHRKYTLLQIESVLAADQKLAKGAGA